MSANHIVIVGGGLAGLSAGTYARASGFRTTIVEHNLALGGVCTAWRRGDYLVDGCIHWLTGGPFDRIYRELGILQQLQLKPITHFAQVRSVKDDLRVDITSDLGAVARQLTALAPEDAKEIEQIIRGAAQIARMSPQFDNPPELQTWRDGLSVLWNMREELPSLIRFRKSVKAYSETHLKSPRLRRVLALLFDEDVPMIFLLMILGYLQKGWLSRPMGGTQAFRDAAISAYHRMGGTERLHSTVDEILVRDDRVRGVRLGDGSMIDADAVISTSSAPETVLRLLGGRYGAEDLRRKMREWKLFTPIVLATYGVEKSLAGLPQTIHLEGIEPIEIGNTVVDQLYIRVYNDDPAFAPSGHSVIQVLAQTDYEWWATRGAQYTSEKHELGNLLLAVLDQYVPGVLAAARMTDLSTPLTFWNMARSWRGAYEGWMPSSDAMFGHVPRTLKGLEGFYMAGQWVEPGGGVPAVCASGRSAVQLLCATEKRDFMVPVEVPPKDVQYAEPPLSNEPLRPTLH